MWCLQRLKFVRSSIPSLLFGLDGPYQLKSGRSKLYLAKPGTEFSGFLFLTIKNPLSRARRKQHKTTKMRFFSKHSEMTKNQ